MQRERQQRGSAVTMRHPIGGEKRPQAGLEERGVPSGEHGAGRLRAGVLDRFYGDDVMELFRTVKRAYDPLSIFNPGVIIPANDWSPVTALKVGDDAAAIPDDIATRLRDVERTAAWATPKLQLAR